jgi:hypothetical protein
MNYFSVMLIIGSCLIFSGIAKAGPLILNSPNIVFTNQQPIEAIIVDANGNPTTQTIYYNGTIGGFDIPSTKLGPNASIYFPSLQTGYIWHNGFWVDEGGSYFLNGQRHYVTNPEWHTHWSTYWGGYSHYHPHSSTHIHEAAYHEGHHHFHHH